MELPVEAQGCFKHCVELTVFAISSAEESSLVSGPMDREKQINDMSTAGSCPNSLFFFFEKKRPIEIKSMVNGVYLFYYLP